MTDLTYSAVVVARAGSKRVPGKALLPFAGSTLVGLKVQTLKQVPEIDRVFIGSDSDDILSVGEKHGAVPVKRDEYHCDESKCTANEMLKDMAGKVTGDIVVWAHPTNPLVTAETFSRAIDAYENKPHLYDSLVSVYEGGRRHAWCGGRPVNYWPWEYPHTIAADCDPVYYQNGAIFIQPRVRMIETAYFFGRHPWLFVMDVAESTDIDTPEDFERAEKLWKERHD